MLKPCANHLVVIMARKGYPLALLMCLACVPRIDAGGSRHPLVWVPPFDANRCLWDRSLTPSWLEKAVRNNYCALASHPVGLEGLRWGREMLRTCAYTIPSFSYNPPFPQPISRPRYRPRANDTLKLCSKLIAPACRTLQRLRLRWREFRHSVTLYGEGCVRKRVYFIDKLLFLLEVSILPNGPILIRACCTVASGNYSHLPLEL